VRHHLMQDPKWTEPSFCRDPSIGNFMMMCSNLA